MVIIQNQQNNLLSVDALEYMVLNHSLNQRMLNSKRIRTSTTKLSVSVDPGQIKYYDTVKPDTVYAWILYAINTGTWAICANDYNNAGLRVKNNNATQSSTGNIEMCWFRFG